ncbi:MAG: hypothetical protein AAFR61_00800 [Bacteroidota bacterium]
MADSTHEWIEQYLHGQLSEAARKAFEQRCQNDLPFRKEVQVHLRMHTLIRATAYSPERARLNQLLQKLGPSDIDLAHAYQQLEAEHPELYGAPPVPPSQEMPFIRRVPFWKWGVAVAAMVLIALPFYFFSSPPPRSGEGYFALYYERPVAQVRAQATLEDSAWIQAKWAYLEQAPQALDQLLALRQEIAFVHPSEASLYIGILYMEAEAWEKALQNLDEVSVNSYFYDMASWYKALIWLRKEDWAQAREVLQGIQQQQGHPYQKQALSLLDALARTGK